jgi:hypothetical protein
MEFEQIIKRLDWLDEQHRKDKDSIAEIKDQVTGLENENKALKKRSKS